MSLVHATGQLRSIVGFSQVPAPIGLDWQCSICLEDKSGSADVVVAHPSTSDPDRWICHVHRNCLRQWWEVDPSQRCPTCQQSFVQETSRSRRAMVRRAMVQGYPELASILRETLPRVMLIFAAHSFVVCNAIFSQYKPIPLSVQCRIAIGGIAGGAMGAFVPWVLLVSTTWFAGVAWHLRKIPVFLSILVASVVAVWLTYLLTGALFGFILRTLLSTEQWSQLSTVYPSVQRVAELWQRGGQDLQLANSLALVYSVYIGAISSSIISTLAYDMVWAIQLLFRP